jgi:biopolymer transport protein ExbB
MSDISAKFLGLTLHGAAWVLWLLIGLSVVSLGVMFERWWYFRTHRLVPAALAADVRCLLRLAAGPGGFDRAPPAAELCAAIEGAKARERLRLERHLAFLATLGSNGPFIGLFGTVLGIIKAFHDLASGQLSGGASVVMTGISEALVATAIGLMVAIPAVVAFNYFSRCIKVRMAEVEWMAQLAASEVTAGICHAQSMSERISDPGDPMLGLGI